MREQNQSRSSQPQEGEFPPAFFPVEMMHLWQENMVRQFEFLYQVNERALAALPYFSSMLGKVSESVMMNGHSERGAESRPRSKSRSKGRREEKKSTGRNRRYH